MATKPRNKASMTAERVAQMLVDAQEHEHQEPPADAQPAAPPPVQAEVAPPPAPPPVAVAVPAIHPPAEPQAWDPGKVDGRTLRRTGREPFATRIKPETHEALRRIAYERRITMAEALELAVAAFTSR